TNLTAYTETKLSELKAEYSKPKYRNRAAERRKMYGQPNHIPIERPGSGEYVRQEKVRNLPPAWYFKEHFEKDITTLPVPLPTAANQSISEDNIGNKMLQRLGWKEGQGLGAKKDGITAPIQAEGYVKGAGIGSIPVFRGQ
ncbi:RNA-binding protein 5, partial [Chytridiales sp. JEL 0842]